VFVPNAINPSRRRRLLPRARLAAIAVGGVLALSTAFLTVGSASAFASTGGSSFNFGNHTSTVYTETNQTAGNAVIVYSADPGGGLTQIASVPTGGTGTGTSPGSQGGVTLGDNGRLLAVVNGGSNSVSVFSVDFSGQLRLIDTTSSGGIDPISVTINGLWVYALNAGSSTTPANIAGSNLFFPNPVGAQPLNAAASSPEQISYTPNGRDLLVTEKASNTIDVFPVNFFGLAEPAVTTTVATGTGPYGFAFNQNGDAIVSDAGISSLSSFSVNLNGTLTAISGPVSDGQAAPCWVALTSNGREAFTANAHSGNVSAYTVAPNGSLSLLSPAVQTSVNVGDTDLAVAGNSTLYISDQPNFDASTITPSGALSPSAVAASGLPAGTFGLAATD
jgi:6-phosphogluconolactonase (cycloisomerase 2 family)